MNNKERIALMKQKRNVLALMKKEVGEQLLKYFQERSEDISDFKLNRLKLRYESSGGSASMLLSKIMPKRVKFFQNGTFSRPALINVIIGAEDFLLVYDLQTEKLAIEERPKIEPQEF